MDRVARYREIVGRVVEGYTEGKYAYGEIEAKLVIDPVRDHYVVYHVGWQQRRRVYGTVVHVDIIGGKCWVQYDGTDHPIAEELAAAGIPREDIVLAFHAPEMRKYTEFAAG